MKFSKCPRCGSVLRPAKNLQEGNCNTFLECSNTFCPTVIDNFQPLTMQYNFLKDSHKRKGVFGGFGCHNPEAKILMFDGNIKQAKDIKPKDKLMGPDSKPRNVLEVHQGIQPMYQMTIKNSRVKQTPLFFNEEHQLYLQYYNYQEGKSEHGYHTYDGQFSMPTIKEYIKKSKRYKSNHMWVFSQGLEFENKQVPIDPYFLGLLLGDGSLTHNTVSLTSEDQEIINYCYTQQDKFDVHIVLRSKNGTTKTKQIHFVKNNKSVKSNQLVNALRLLNLMETKSDTKFIPDIYKVNSKENRRKILAGIIDTDGYHDHGNIEITLKGKQLSDDIKFIAQSLGIRVTQTIKKIKTYPDNLYYKLTLRGPELNHLPVLLERKKIDNIPNKRHYLQRFEIEKVSDLGTYFGFSVDGDQLYIEAEHFSIIHNSGKSFSIIKDVQKHCLITPGAYVAVIGFTYRQIKRNFKKDFDEDTPAVLMKRGRNEKTIGFNQIDMTYTFANGAKIELITADEEGKIRGMNATKVVFLEVSNVAYEIFDLSKSRVRNMASSKIRQDAHGNDLYILNKTTNEWVPDIEAEWGNIVMESNPEANWINKEFLLKAESVQFYGSSYNKYPYRLKEIDDEYSLHISATDGNPYLPPNYLAINTAGKPPWEVKRFYYGSFLFSQNMVYPRFNERLIDPYPIPWDDPNVFFIIGYDYGISDLSAFVFGFVNFKKNSITYYDELAVRDLSVKEIAKQYREKLSVIPDGKLLFLPAMDAKSYNKRGGDKNTIGSLFEDAGLLFDPTQDDPDVRTMKLNSLIDNEQIFWFRTMNLTIEEFSDYKFIVNSKGEVTDKRVDKRNHLCDATEFSLVKIPFNLEKMTIINYITPGTHIIADRFRNKKKLELTMDQKRHRATNPLEQTFKNYEEDNFDVDKYSDNEIDSIISKLSGI